MLVVDFSEAVLDDHNGFVTTDYVEITPRLLKAEASQYNVDPNRLCVTGQSMGCMIFLLLSAKYPDVFAAEMFVSGQWAIEDIDHSRTKARHPQTTGICERYHRAIQEGLYQVAYRKKIYHSINKMQANSDQ